MDNYFRHNQGILLKFANTPIGKKILGFEHDQDQIVQITPSSLHFLRGKKGKKFILQAYFYNNFDLVNSPSLKLANALEKVLIANEEWKPVNLDDAFLHYSGYKKGNYPHIYLTTSTFSNSFSSISILDYSGSYSTTHSGSGATAGVNNWQNVGSSNGGIVNYYDGTNYSISRFFMHFNTAALTSAAIITSAFVYVTGTSTHFNNADSDSVAIVASTVVSNTTLATSDFVNLGTTSYGSLAFSSWSQSSQNNITLNSTGLAAISLTSYTKFALRTLNDMNNVAPATNGSDNVSFSDNGTLSVTYTLPVSGGFFLAANA